MKKSRIVYALLLCFITASLQAQKIYTKNGTVSFFSKTSMEDIKADNNQVMSILNIPTGEIQFSLLVKSFQFEKALMEEHFNENYMESEKFPKATFKGIISNMSKISISTDGTYPALVEGEMNIHGVSKKISTQGTITVKAGKVSAYAKFGIKPSDYEITIPKLVKGNIAESIDVTVNINFDQKM